MSLGRITSGEKNHGRHRISGEIGILSCNESVFGWERHTHNTGRQPG